MQGFGRMCIANERKTYRPVDTAYIAGFNFGDAARKVLQLRMIVPKACHISESGGSPRRHFLQFHPCRSAMAPSAVTNFADRQRRDAARVGIPQKSFARQRFRHPVQSG